MGVGSTDSERFERMETLRGLLNEREHGKPYPTDFPEKEAIEECCDAAGLGIISHPEAWFHDHVAGRYGEDMLLFRQEYHESTDFILVRVRTGGWSGPPFEWNLYVLPHYARAPRRLRGAHPDEPS